MAWKIINKHGEVLEDNVNCHYDALDLSVMLYNAKYIVVNFEEETATIIE